jgi:hypothetical protein
LKGYVLVDMTHGYEAMSGIPDRARQFLSGQVTPATRRCRRLGLRALACTYTLERVGSPVEIVDLPLWLTNVGGLERSMFPHRGRPMNHTGSTPDNDGTGEGVKTSPLANPRRTRLGADGRPIVGPVTTTSD